MARLSSEEIGRRLRAAREACGLTQDDVAHHLGLSRPTIVQLELGNRPVTSVELAKLAYLFGRDIGEFLAEDFSEEDAIAALFRADDSAQQHPTLVDGLRDCLSLARQLTKLEELVGVERELAAVSYSLDPPRSKWDAIQQGARVADQERARLGIGWAPVADLSELMETQGVRTGLAPLPSGISGLTLSHRATGMFVVVNQEHTPSRRRFSFAHEYAHVLIDRGRFGIVSREADRASLLEVRANAFAADFLMPAEGVTKFMEALGKGGQSRSRARVFDGIDAVPVEGRSAPGSQDIQLYDLAHMAHHFSVSQESALYRLLNLRFVTDAEFGPLKEAIDRVGHQVAEFLSLSEPSTPDTESEFRHRLLNLALEAFRRRLITRGKLHELAGTVSRARSEVDQLIRDAGLEDEEGVGVEFPDEGS